MLRERKEAEKEVNSEIKEIKAGIREGKIDPQTVEAVLKLLIVGFVKKARMYCDSMDSAWVVLELNPAHLTTYRQLGGPEENVLRVEFSKRD